MEVADEFRNVTAITGIVLAALSLLGVAFLIVSKVMSFVKYRRYFDEKRALPNVLVDRRLQWGVLTWNTPLTLLPDVAFPLVFVVAWSYLVSHG
jgi:hypothetical protein